jgi:hypothetical protein
VPCEWECKSSGHFLFCKRWSKKKKKIFVPGFGYGSGRGKFVRKRAVSEKKMKKKMPAFSGLFKRHTPNKTSESEASCYVTES